MLELKKISKVYTQGKAKAKNFQSTHALREINIEFRKNEFVSILGPSGCGKTTLLNIVGGLDRYTKGDLVLNGYSTKNFSDKEWDFYRNRFVGFVFQNYNLIPHQTVLQNVELALTLSGIGIKERKLRATEVLKQVGLGDKLNSRPNQLSGGQMQRVAIARALVNDPEIILADEPTGALDSKTSVQIMNLLKKISKTRLVVMVTHNSEIAEEFSTRIIKMLDGNLISDSNPYDSENLLKQETANEKLKENSKDESDLVISKEKKEIVNEEKTENSNENLENKNDVKKLKNKGMSIFTALSLSFKNLLTKKARTFLVSFAGSIGIIGIALILALSNGFQGYVNSIQTDTLSTYPITIQANSTDYSSVFDAFLNQGDGNGEQVDGAVSSNDTLVNLFKAILAKSTSNDLTSFKEFLDESEEIKDLTTAIQYTYNINKTIFSEANEQLNPNSLFYRGIEFWLDTYAEREVFKDLEEEYRETLENPNRELTENEINDLKANITDEAKKQKIDDYLASLYSMGSSGGTDFSMGMDIQMALKSLENSDLNLWAEMIDNNEFISSQYDVVASNYSDGLENDCEKLLNQMGTNDCVLVLDESGNLTDYSLYALGIKTSPTIEEIAAGLVDSKNYVIEPSSFEYNEILGMKYKFLLDTDYYLPIGEGGAYVDIRKALEGNDITQEQYDSHLANLFEDEAFEITIRAILKPKPNVSATSINSPIGYSKALTEFMIDKQNTSIDDKNLSKSKIDVATPSSISIYCADFDSKKEIENLIAEYNESVDESKQITYTDYVDVLMSSISMIIDSTAIVLIAFVAVSLVVSSIMIGIIISISVLERTKEIGILRSIGASKRDVRRVFTAESLIIGFMAGIFGILITLILCVPANILITEYTGIVGIATLPIISAVVLILLSTLLTFISGLIPSHSASKKDPVIALRTE
ncbi:MAG: ABC transporter ATP-binding protein/permease [Clostridia bacterium]|jgi:putative ABC transport system permease protein|nr:ABC transporter ATP-binding protein/permease [Clostridia bacterium]